MKQFIATIGLALLITCAVRAGPVVIDGTDANDHGAATNGVNLTGWLYMQKVLENIASQLDPSVVKVVVDLGTTDNGSTQIGARAAINSAFDGSSLPSLGWTLVHVDGAAEIDSWLANLSTANTGILYIPTAGNTDGDLTGGELDVVNNHSTEINRFVSGNGNPLKGGGLFAMGESPLLSGSTAYGWLIDLLPEVTVTDVGAGGVGNPITLTDEGDLAFPGLTSADLSAGPWHNYFDGDFGGLSVLGTAPDEGGVTRALIIGGGAGTSFTQLHDMCITRNALFWFSHPDNTETNCASLLNAFRAVGGGMNLGFIKLPSGFRNNDNVRDAQDSVIEALGLFWKNRFLTGELAGTQDEHLRGSSLCYLRKQLAIQLIAATANSRFLGTSPTNCMYFNGITVTNFPSDLLKQARLAAAAEDTKQIHSMIRLLKKFNSGGMTNDFFGDLVECNATGASALRKRGRDPTLQFTCPGVNDFCETAQAVTSLPFSRSLDLATYADHIASPVCGVGGADAVWKISPPVGAVDRKFTVDTVGSNFDTLLSIWTGTCSNLVQVACNDNNGFSAQAKVSFRTNGTNTFFIVAEGLNGATGLLKIKVTSP